MGLRRAIHQLKSPFSRTNPVAAMAQRLFSRPGGWVAVGSGLVLAVGALAGASAVLAAPSPPALQAVTAHLAYGCRFPAGTYPASVTVAASFPSSVAVHQAIAPGQVRTGVTLGPAAASALSKLGAVNVTGDAVLGTVVGDGMDMTSGQWPGRLARPAAVRAGAPLRLAATGLVPPLTAGRPGTVTFTAAGLSLSLSPRTASGRPARPGMVRVMCALRPGQRATLASVRVGKAAVSSHNRPARRPKAVPGVKFPKGCGKIPVKGIGVPTCAYITGYADVRKLNGAALLQPTAPAKPGLLNLDFAEHTAIQGGNLVADSTGQLYYKGREELPPVRGTFLTFGFIPVTATLHITELIPIKIVSISGIKGLPFPITVHSTTKVTIRVSDAVVNGEPLALGPHCRTRSPVTLKLLGKGFNTQPPQGYTVPTGGPLTGNITIPPFTGCGVTENLNRLLTGTISGPANFNLITQGQLCGPSQPENFTCPPPIPKPLRKVPNLHE
jgi:hypothetical protein